LLVRETPGLSLTGGMIGGLVFLYIYSLKKKMNILHVLDIFSIVISVSLVFAKIGEQLGGAAFGRETQLFTGVKIIGKIGKFHPVELYEALTYLIIFVSLILIYNLVKKHKYPDGFVFNIFIILSGLSIFTLEFFKEYSVYLYKLDIRQVFILPVILISLIPLSRTIIYLVKNRKDIKK
jgi:phosphatidylglycerol---prolipoprotein diacylglyceryl transferase